MPDSSLTPSGQTFDEVWAVADRIPGWMTKGQAELLDEQARRLPDGSAVLRNTALYSDVTGLSLDGDAGKAEFI